MLNDNCPPCLFSLISSLVREGSLGNSLMWVREESFRSSSSSLPNSSVRPWTDSLALGHSKATEQ